MKKLKFMILLAVSACIFSCEKESETLDSVTNDSVSLDNSAKLAAGEYFDYDGIHTISACAPDLDEELSFLIGVSERGPVLYRYRGDRVEYEFRTNNKNNNLFLETKGFIITGKIINDQPFFTVEEKGGERYCTPSPLSDDAFFRYGGLYEAKVCNKNKKIADFFIHPGEGGLRLDSYENGNEFYHGDFESRPNDKVFFKRGNFTMHGSIKNGKPRFRIIETSGRKLCAVIKN